MVQPSAGVTFSGNTERLCQQGCFCLFRKNIFGSGVTCLLKVSIEHDVSPQSVFVSRRGIIASCCQSSTAGRASFRLFRSTLPYLARRRPAPRLRNTAPQFLAGQGKGEGLE